MFKIDKERVIVEDLNYPGYDETADIEVINENFRKLKEKNESQDNAINGKEPKINKKSGFNLDKTDVPENNTNKLFSAKGALDLKNWIVTAYTNAINTTKSALENLIKTKLSHGGYGGTGQDLKRLVDTAQSTADKNKWFIDAKVIGRTDQNIDILELCKTLEPGFYISKSANNKFTSLPTGFSTSFYLLIESIGGGYRKIKISDHFNNTTYYNTHRSIQGVYSWEGWSKVYQEDDKPTLDELGAFSVNGGTFKGSVKLKKDQYIENGASGLDAQNSTIKGVNNILFADISNGPTEGILFPKTNTPSSTFNINEYDSVWVNSGRLRINNSYVYDTDHKPTPSEIGALAKNEPAIAIGNGAINLQYQNSNELNFYQTSDRIWFGYRGNGEITTYLFGNAKGSSDGVKVISDYFESRNVNVKSGDINIFIPVTSGGHARGIEYYSSDGSKTLAGIGELGGGTTLSTLNMGFGDNWYDLEEGGFRVEKERLLCGIRGRYEVLHTGNINAKYCPHRVGDVITTYNSSNPNTTWVGTSWTRVLIGRTPVGQDSGQTEFNTVGKQGGAKTHTLTLAQITPHNHTFVIRMDADESGEGPYYGTPGNGHFGSQKTSNPTSNTGGGEPHNNLQPYEVVYFWKRTA